MLQKKCELVISKNILRVNSEINSICKKAGRDPNKITVLGASKSQSIEKIREAYISGINHFGENYLQEAESKIDSIGGDVTWHFIGSIQSRKAKKIAEIFDWAHAVDSVKIAKKLNDARPLYKNALKVCIQLNIDKEASKSGIDELIFTRKYEKEFLDKMKLLSNLPATKYTRASDFVEQIARETKKLLDKGEAYQTDEGIFLQIEQEEHGKLLRVDLESSLAQGTKEVDSGPKKSPHDTLLWGPPMNGGNNWKFEGLPEGRPGWHLECTLMSSSELDLPIDIHWGGIDLIYPHHETEMIIAEKMSLFTHDVANEANEMMNKWEVIL